MLFRAGLSKTSLPVKEFQDPSSSMSVNAMVVARPQVHCFAISGDGDKEQPVLNERAAMDLGPSGDPTAPNEEQCTPGGCG